LPFVREGNLAFSKADWKCCGELGLHGLPIPKEYGGSGFDALTTVVGLESLGYSCNDAGLPFAIAAQMLSCLVPIHKFGNQQQKSDYLPDLCAGTTLMANSITEKNSGSDVYSMESEAVLSDGNYLLNGEKTMITNAPIADKSLVYMATNKSKGYFGGITAFLVNHEKEGVYSEEVLEKIGMESVQMGSQRFSKVKVGPEDVLGKEGAGGPIFSESMNWERACLGAVHVGLMSKINEVSAEYARKRKAGNKYISNYQAVSHKIADMNVRLQSCKLMVYKAAWDLDHEKNPGKSASMAKLYVSTALQKTCLEAFSIMGGSAYLKGSFIESYLRAALSATIYSGTSDVQRNIISSYIGL
jgi:alkylation response protein AidB-like acyl-CoA dehydrogenase